MCVSLKYCAHISAAAKSYSCDLGHGATSDHAYNSKVAHVL
jgi:hypothetical protein